MTFQLAMTLFTDFLICFVLVPILIVVGNQQGKLGATQLKLTVAERELAELVTDLARLQREHSQEHAEVARAAYARAGPAVGRCPACGASCEGRLGGPPGVVITMPCPHCGVAMQMATHEAEG